MSVPPASTAPIGNNIETAVVGAAASPRVMRFLRHFLVMLVAMYGGMLALNPVYDWAAGRTGYADPWTQLPVLSAMVMAFNMTVPMAIWMRWHRHGWRPVGEMAGAMFAPAVLSALLYLAGAVSAEAVMGIGHIGMFLAMLGAMLYRYRAYAA